MFQGGGKLPVAGNRVGVRAGGQQLNAHVVGPGVDELAQLGRDPVRLTVRDQGVDQRVAACSGQVRIRPAEAGAGY